LGATRWGGAAWGPPSVGPSLSTPGHPPVTPLPISIDLSYNVVKRGKPQFNAMSHRTIFSEIQRRANKFHKNIICIANCHQSRPFEHQFINYEIITCTFLRIWRRFTKRFLIKTIKRQWNISLCYISYKCIVQLSFGN
jgi:hypothetical protein